MISTYFDRKAKEIMLQPDVVAGIAELINKSCVKVANSSAISQIAVDSNPPSNEALIQALKQKLLISKKTYKKYCAELQSAKEIKSTLKNTLKYLQDSIESVNCLVQYSRDYRKPRLYDKPYKISHYSDIKLKSEENLKQLILQRDENIEKELSVSENIALIKDYINSHKLFIEIYETLANKKPVVSKKNSEIFSIRQDKNILKSHAHLKTVKSTGPEFVCFKRRNIKNEALLDFRDASDIFTDNISGNSLARSDFRMQTEINGSVSKNSFASILSASPSNRLISSRSGALNRANIERLSLIEKKTRYQFVVEADKGNNKDQGKGSFNKSLWKRADTNEPEKQITESVNRTLTMGPGFVLEGARVESKKKNTYVDKDQLKSYQKYLYQKKH